MREREKEIDNKVIQVGVGEIYLFIFVFYFLVYILEYSV